MPGRETFVPSIKNEHCGLAVRFAASTGVKVNEW